MSGVLAVTDEIPVVACMWDRALRPVPMMTAHPQNGTPRWSLTRIRLHMFGPGLSFISRTVFLGALFLALVFLAAIFNFLPMQVCVVVRCLVPVDPVTSRL
jgi:hypothetical protein